MRKSEEMFYVPTRIVKNSARIRCINFKRLWLLLFFIYFLFTIEKIGFLFSNLFRLFCTPERDRTIRSVFFLFQSRDFSAQNDQTDITVITSSLYVPNQ